MDADTGQHGEEGKPHIRTALIIGEIIVVENPVVHAFTGGPVLINTFILSRAAGNGRIETDIVLRLDIAASAIWRGRAVSPAGTGIEVLMGSSQRAPEFDPAAAVIHTIANHAFSCKADRSTICIPQVTIFIESRFATVSIEINERIQMPMPAKTVCRIVIVSRIEADIFKRQIRVLREKFMNRDNPGNRIVPSGAGNADMQGQINVPGNIMNSEGIDGVAEEILFEVTVISPGRAGI